MLRCWDSKNFACEKNGLEQDSLPSTPIKLPIIQNHRFYLANFLLHTSPSNFYFNILNSSNQKCMFFRRDEKWEVVYFFLGIRKIHGHTDTRTLYTDLLFWINFWKLEKYTDPLEKYTDSQTHRSYTRTLENKLVQNWTLCYLAHFVSLEFIKSKILALKFGQNSSFHKWKIPWNQFFVLKSFHISNDFRW